MGCLLVVLSLIVPRIALVLLFLFTRWFQVVFDTWIWPLLGFVFLPYTTLAYMATVLNTGGPITPGWLILIILAVLADLSHYGGGYRVHRRVVVVRRP